jgi:hypothetical protein
MSNKEVNEGTVRLPLVTVAMAALVETKGEKKTEQEKTCGARLVAVREVRFGVNEKRITLLAFNDVLSGFDC